MMADEYLGHFPSLWTHKLISLRNSLNTILQTGVQTRYRTKVMAMTLLTITDFCVAK